MRWIIVRCLKLRLPVVGLAAALLVFGVARLAATPVDALPEFAPPYVEIQTEALGLSAPEVEELITLNLEELLSNTPFLQSMRSRSVPGLSSIILIFEPGTDVLRARQLVSEKLSLAFALPNVSKPPTIVPLKSATSRVMMVGLSSKQVSPLQLSVLARWTIQPALLSVPGVANVAIWGMRDYQLQVLVDPQRLQANHVTLDQIISTTGNALWVSPLTFLNASAPGTGGFIDSPQQRLEVRHIFPISRPQDLDKVIVEGSNLRLGDVATVVEDHQPLIGDDLLNNGSGLLIVIDKLPSANTLDVTNAVEAKLRELQPGLSGIQMDSTIYQPASYITQSMGNLSVALLISALLVLLLFVLYQWRLAVVALLAIPLSVLAAALVVSLRGASINMMVFAGLALALVVLIDEVIGDVERIFRRVRLARAEGNDHSTPRTILDVVTEMRGALIYATLIALLAPLPIFFLSGPSANFYQPLILSYTLALVASVTVALTVTPALCLFLYRIPLDRRESPLLSLLRLLGAQRWYRDLLGHTLGAPRRVLTVAGLFLTLGVATAPFLPPALIPTFKEPDIVIQWDGPPGTSYSEMARVTARAGSELRAVPGVRGVSTLIGRAVLGDQIADVNAAQLIVTVTPSANYDATLAAIQEVIRGYPGSHHVARTYLNDTIQRILPTPSDDIVVRIYGNDLTLLRTKAEEVRQALATIKGADAVRTEGQVDVPEIQVRVDLDKAQRYGLKPGDIRRIASTFVAGIEAGSLFESQKVFSVVVMGTPNTRQSVTSVGNLLIDTPSGGQVRLADVADVSILPTPELIKHDAVSRYIDVTLHAQGRDRSAVLGDVERRLSAIPFPLEFHAETLGDYDAQQAVQVRLIASWIAIAIAAFLLLQTAFSSWRLAALLFFTLPLTLIGGLLAVLITGRILSLGALAGLLVVFAVGVRHGVLLIRRYQHLERHAGKPIGRELILRGAEEQLAPTLLTTLAAALASLPILISSDRAGLEIVHPMAQVIVGGMATVALVTLFLLPALYRRFGPSYSALATRPAPATITQRSQPDATP